MCIVTSCIYFKIYIILPFFENGQGSGKECYKRPADAQGTTTTLIKVFLVVGQNSIVTSFSLLKKAEHWHILIN